jgi:inhibitor of cysteine peptidase
MLLLDDAAAGRSIDVPVGESVELRLQETPSTGFRWTLASDGAPLCELVVDDAGAADRRPGAARPHIWVFAARQPGDCEIELLYRRPWEKEAAPGRRFHLHLHVTPRP